MAAQQFRDLLHAQPGDFSAVEHIPGGVVDRRKIYFHAVFAGQGQLHGGRRGRDGGRDAEKLDGAHGIFAGVHGITKWIRIKTKGVSYRFKKLIDGGSKVACQ